MQWRYCSESVQSIEGFLRCFQATTPKSVNLGLWFQTVALRDPVKIFLVYGMKHKSKCAYGTKIPILISIQDPLI